MGKCISCQKLVDTDYDVVCDECCSKPPRPFYTREPSFHEEVIPERPAPKWTIEVEVENFSEEQYAPHNYARSSILFERYERFLMDLTDEEKERFIRESKGDSTIKIQSIKPYKHEANR